MKKLIFLSVLITLFSCEKKSQYSKELNKVFKAHGDAVAFKNVNTLSFSVDDKDVTFDLHSDKKVVSGQDFSFGYDGKDYWSTEKSPLKNPKEYLQNLSEAMLIPFSLVDKKQTSFDADKKMIMFGKLKVYFNPDTNLIAVTETNDKINLYKEWQQVVGFQLPKLLNVDYKDFKIENLQLSQATFDDRFYQKPN